jgi:hypothetical protein
MRFFWYNGYYVKRNVDVVRYEGGTRSNQYTDIDVICIKFNFDLTKTIEICDCKSGAKAKNAERIFWLSGVMKYFGAAKGYFVRQSVTESKYVDLAKKLEITPLSEQQLTKLEKSYDIDTKPFIGNFENECMIKEGEILIALKEEIKDVYEYINYKYWLQPSSQQINNLINCGKIINKSKLENKYKLFLSAYILNILLNSILEFSHAIIKIPDEEKEKQIGERIIGGQKENYEKTQMLKHFHEFMKSEIKLRYQKKYPISLNDFMDNFYPDYLKDFVNLVQRICLNPIAFISTPQALTILLYEHILLEKEIDINFLVEIFGEAKLHSVLKALTDVIIFGGKCEIFTSEQERILSAKIHELKELNYKSE